MEQQNGGSDMMVEDIGQDKSGKWRVHCEWFDASNAYRSTDLAVTSVEKLQGKRSAPVSHGSKVSA